MVIGKALRKSRALFLFLYCMSAMGGLRAFHNLSEVNAYAQMREEYPDIDNNDWLNPDYSSFHHQLVTSFPQRVMNRILETVYLKKKPIFRVEDFKSLAQEVVRQHEEQEQLRTSITAMLPPPGSKFVIWGAIHGAFHSVARSLDRLKTLGIIDENLTIVQPNYYFVFLGNAIDRSPYSLETVTLILRLMLKNPGRVFYLRGSHEEKGAWHSFALKRELEVRARHLSVEKIPLDSLVKKLFKSLSLALYLQHMQDGEMGLIRISPFENHPKLSETLYVDFLLTEHDRATQLILKQSVPAQRVPSVKAFIASKEWKGYRYQKVNGLEVDQKSKRWFLFSSPTRTHRMLYEFFYDSFCILTTAAKLEDWTIEHHWRDVRTRKGFLTERYSLISGEKLREPFVPDDTVLKERLVKLEEKIKRLEEALKRKDREPAKVEKEPEPALPVKEKPPMVAPAEVEGEIAIGAMVDLSKGASVYGREAVQGLTLRINRENQQGGVHGKIIRLVVLDNEYTPRKAVEVAKRFLDEYRIDMIIHQYGTPTLEAVLPMVKAGKVLMVFPNTGASLFRKPDFKYLFHFRPSYVEAGRILIEYAINDLELRKFAIFYQDDAYGKDGLRGARKALKKHGITSWAEAPYQRNTVEVTQAAKIIEEFDPEAILFSSLHAPSAALIQKLGVGRLAGKTMLGLTDLVDEFKPFLQRKGLNIITSRAVPNAETSDLEIVAQYREDMKNAGFEGEASTDSLDGYISAGIFIDLLRRVEGQITKEKVIAVAEGTKNYPFKGLVLSFNEVTREFSNDMWIDPGNGEWLVRQVKR